jgi:hypothetical protein
MLMMGASLANRDPSWDAHDGRRPGSIDSVPDTWYRLETTRAAEVTNEITFDTFDTLIWPVIIMKAELNATD